MAYTVLARRYRSQAFGDVVGQGPVATTLKNAIKSGRVAHAYLFTGTRGVGKTSMARIFARALNAPATVPDAPPPDGEFEYPEADVQQRMATAIMRGDDLNVIEIDGASNNSVQDARDLIGSAGLAPTSNARYKIYIIDEVHMLSTAAFNALLKTMEEPPSHVKFILCTTEAHKIPATIHSRCQRFDFKNIPTAQIKQHLADVIKTESVQADDEVLYQVAVLGNGSMRDALSLMDRVIAAAGEEKRLTVELLENMLGLPPRQRVVGLVDALASGDVASALRQADEVMASGIGQEQLIDVLIERLRQLMLIAACGKDSELVELSPEARAEAATQAERFDAAGLVHMIALCEGLSRNGKSSSNPRALLDAVIVRLALAEKMADVTALLAGAEKKKLVLDPPARPAASLPQARSSAPQTREVASVPQAAPPRDTPQTQEEHAAPHPPADLRDPGAVWAELLSRVQNVSSFAWVDQITLGKLDMDGGVCVIRPKPGQRDIARFAGQRQRDRLAGELSELLRRPIRIELDAPSGGSPALAESSGDGPRRSVGATERQKAIGLPLVKDVLDVFPDAVLMDTRRERSESGDEAS